MASTWRNVLIFKFNLVNSHISKQLQMFGSKYPENLRYYKNLNFICKRIKSLSLYKVSWLYTIFFVYFYYWYLIMAPCARSMFWFENGRPATIVLIESLLTDFLISVTTRCLKYKFKNGKAYRTKIRTYLLWQ